MSFFQSQPPGVGPATWTVAELNAYIRQLFELDYRLQDIDVTGEISNFTRASSGHLYFTLKDSGAQVRCVMWRSQAERLRFRPGEGDAVLVHGRVSVYEASGQYQLYVDLLQPAGRGDLSLAFERLKEQLAAEGLFDAEWKQPIPAFPQRLGIVTSANAAALRDILNVLQRRNPLLSVLIAPTLVQGDQAPAQIVRALQWLDGRNDIDTILIARGGGSIEDLWAFNDERVARAVFAARHPIISGVGHETDFTIVDFVADLRAPTPSAAAELATPDVSELVPYLVQAQQRLGAAVSLILASEREGLAARRRWLRLLSPRSRLDSERQHIDVLAERLTRIAQRQLDQWRTRLDIARTGLASANPLAILQRGYAIVRREDGSIVNRTSQALPGAGISVQVSDGSFDATINDPG